MSLEPNAGNRFDVVSGGNVNITTGAGGLMTLQGDPVGGGGVIVKGRGPNGSAVLANEGDFGVFVNSPVNTVPQGCSVAVAGRFGMTTGLRLLPNEGTFAVPAAATLQTPGGYLFEMDGNKAFITTGGAAFTLIVRLPVTDNNWVINYGAIGAPSSLNVAQVVTGGSLVTFQSANLTLPITLWITCM
jgi:hypothetical protein